MKIRYLAITIVLVTLFSTSCGYEEGPAISFRSASSRVAKHWRYNIVTRNGFEITYQFKGQSLEFLKSGEAKYYFIDSTLTGNWTLGDNRKNLKVQLGLSNGKDITIDYFITRLKNDELTMYTYYNFVEVKYYLKPFDD